MGKCQKGNMEIKKLGRGKWIQLNELHNGPKVKYWRKQAETCGKPPKARKPTENMCLIMLVLEFFY
jgi:hypothetical protein